MLIEINQKDDICVVRVRGAILPGADSEYLRTKEEEIKRRQCYKVLADFQEVPSIGSTGLCFVLNVFESCGGRFVLTSPHPRVREVLELTQLNGVLPMAADLASGLAALEKIN